MLNTIMFFSKNDAVYAIIFNMPNTIVVDTNIFVSALISSSGGSREIVRQCLNGNRNPLISNTLFLEYEELTKRQKIRELCPLTDSEIRDFLNAFYSVCHWIPIYYLWRPNLSDEGDTSLIKLALAGNAKYMITHNTSDFKNAELRFPNLYIVKPEQFLGDK